MTVPNPKTDTNGAIQLVPRTKGTHFSGRIVQLTLSHEDLLVEPCYRPTVLIVDPSELNRRLLRGILKAADYRILEAVRAAEALSIVEHEKVDLVITDLLLPELSGEELCRRLKANRATHLIPILMTSSVQGVDTEVAAITAGADEFLFKPLNATLVRTRIRAMLRNKSIVDSLEEAENILFSLARSVEQRDEYTGLHCERLASYSVALGNALGLSRTDLLALYRGGFLHDVGKISVPDAILFKQDRLTDAEWAIMRAHTTQGEAICRPMKTLAPVLPIIRNHHERWDGSGYPDGMKGEEIPLLARILQIADIYDALTTERPYKPALSCEAALQVMEEETRRGWRDPELVSLFAEIASSPSIDLGLSMQQSLVEMDRALRE